MIVGFNKPGLGFIVFTWRCRVISGIIIRAVYFAIIVPHNFFSFTGIGINFNILFLKTCHFVVGNNGFFCLFLGKNSFGEWRPGIFIRLLLLQRYLLLFTRRSLATGIVCFINFFTGLCFIYWFNGVLLF